MRLRREKKERERGATRREGKRASFG